jgi:hypothetical protein
VKKIILLTVGCVVFGTAFGWAQITVSLGQANLHPGKIGLGLDGITGSPNILMKYFFNNQLAGQIIFGMDINSPGGTVPAGQTKVTGIELRGGASLLFHITQDQVTPYVGVEGIFQTTKDGGFFTTIPDRKNIIVTSIVFGAEYFMYEKFSVGIKQNLGLEVMLARNIPKEENDIFFHTSTLMTGRFYFN